MSTDPDALRAELDALGARRQQHEDEDAELAEEIRNALQQVEQTNGAISKVEAAQRLKMHRTTLYRVYGSVD